MGPSAGGRWGPSTLLLLWATAGLVLGRGIPHCRGCKRDRQLFVPASIVAPIRLGNAPELPFIAKPVFVQHEQMSVWPPPGPRAPARPWRRVGGSRPATAKDEARRIAANIAKLPEPAGQVTDLSAVVRHRAHSGPKCPLLVRADMKADIAKPARLTRRRHPARSTWPRLTAPIRFHSAATPS